MRNGAVEGLFPTGKHGQGSTTIPQNGGDIRKMTKRNLVKWIGIQIPPLVKGLNDKETLRHGVEGFWDAIEKAMAIMAPPED